MALSVFSYLGGGLYYTCVYSYKIYTCYNIACRGRELYDATQAASPENKVGQVAFATLNVASAASQVADIVTDFVAPPGARLFVKGTVTLLESARIITEISTRKQVFLEEGLGVGVITVYRVIEVSKLYFNFAQIPLKETQIIMDTALFIAGVGGLTCDVLKMINKANSVENMQAHEIIKYVKKLGIDETKFDRALRSMELRAAIVRDPVLREFMITCKSMLCHTHQYSDVKVKSKILMILQLLQMTDPYDNEACRQIINIPKASEFAYFPFSKTLCPRVPLCSIDGSPIRNVLVIKGTENQDYPVYYDRYSIQQWFATQTKKPPLWPTDIPFSTESLIECEVIQQKIDKTMEMMISMIQLVEEEDMYNKQILPIQNAAAYYDMFLIPAMWREGLPWFTCAIEKRPIRFVCKLNGVKDVYYEKSSVLSWLTTYPNKRPEGWPSNVPYNRDSIEDAQEEQILTSTLLCQMFNEIKEDVS